jgi:hypothetical protein
MDQLYFESGYLEEGYFGIIRIAEGAFSIDISLSATVDIANTNNYFISDYIEEDYFQAPVKQGEATITSTFNKTITVNKILQLSSEITSAFTPTLIVSALLNHTAILDSVVNMNTTAIKTTTAQSTLDHMVTLSLQGDRQAVLAATTLSSEFTQSTQINSIKSSNSDLNSAFTINVDGDILAAAIEGAAVLTTEFTQQLTGNIIKGVSVSTQSEFNHITQADRIRSITADILISFQSANVITGFLQDAQVNITDAFTPTITAVALKNHTAVLDVVCSLSCVISKTTDFGAVFVTETVQTTQVDRIRPAVINVDCVITQLSTVSKTVIVFSDQNIQFTVNTVGGKLKQTTAVFYITSTVTATSLIWKSKWYGSPRPLTWNKSTAATLRSNDILLAKTSQETAVNSGVNDWFTIGEQDFTIEFGMGIQNAFQLTSALPQEFVPFMWFVKPNQGSGTINYNLPELNQITQTTIGYSNIIGYFNKWNGQSSERPHYLIIALADPTFGLQTIGSLTIPYSSTFLNVYISVGRQNGVFKFECRYDNNFSETYTTVSTTTTLPNYVSTNIPATRTISLINNYGNVSGVTFNLNVNYFLFKIGEYTFTGEPVYQVINNESVLTNPVLASEYTKTYAEFNSNLNDTLASLLSAQASITAATTVTAQAGKSVSASAQLNSTHTLVAIIGKLKTADVNINAEFTHTTIGTRIKQFDSAIVAEFTQTTVAQRTLPGAASITAQHTLELTITRIFVLQSNFESIATQLTSVARVGAGLILAEVFVNQSVTAVKTAVAQADATVISTLVLAADRFRLTTANTQIEFTLNTVNSRIRALNSAQQTDSALTVTTVRIRSTDSTQNSAFTIFCEPLPILRGISNQSAQFTQSIITDRIRSTSVAFNTIFTQQSNGIIAVDAVAALSTQSQITCVVDRFRPGVIIMDAIAVKVTAAAKTGTGLVTIQIQSQCTTTAQKTTDILLNVSSTAQLTSVAERTQQGAANINGQFTQIANGITSTDVTANLNTIFSTTTTAQKTARVIANITSAGGFVMAVAAIRNGEIIMVTQTNITTLADRRRNTDAVLSNSFTVNILAGVLAVANSVQNTQFAIIATVSKLRLDDIVLYIKTESRTHHINNEQRSYALRQENRLYTIEE